MGSMVDLLSYNHERKRHYTTLRTMIISLFNQSPISNVSFYVLTNIRDFIPVIMEERILTRTQDVASFSINISRIVIAFLVYILINNSIVLQYQYDMQLPIISKSEVVQGKIEGEY
jgi:hypothetical protein